MKTEALQTHGIEDHCVGMLVATLARSARQIHRVHESDAELIRLPGGDLILAVTTDSIVEEIETGLYADPELIGWMTVTANLSDLAAVGADPLGLLLSVTLAPETADQFIAPFRRGVDAACRAAGTAVLGGDTNFSANPQCGGTAIGLIPDGRPLTRRGARPGDVLFASGPLGAGSAFALKRLVLGEEAPFRPTARLREGRIARRIARCAMDTSDGLLAALDQLGAVNGVGFEVDLDAPALLDPGARALARAQGIPPWVMLAGPHGEFELVFTLPPERIRSFTAAAALGGWRPVRLGEVLREEGVRFRERGIRRPVDVAAIRKLGATAGGDAAGYLAELLRLGS